VGLERGPLSLVSTTVELRERKSSCSGLESREYGRRNPSRWLRGTLYPQKLTLTSPTSGSRSGTHVTEFSFLYHILNIPPPHFNILDLFNRFLPYAAVPTVCGDCT
jgi:hypothetical protein